jgi:hypothetical protein
LVFGFIIDERQCSLIIAERGADRLRNVAPLIIIAVGAPGPRQVTAEEAVAVVPRHDVHVEVGHALADDVIDCHERAMGVGCLRHGSCEALHEGKERTYLGNRQVWKRCHVCPGYEQDMTRQERTPVEKCDACRLIENDFRGRIATDDRTEDTPNIGYVVFRLELDIEDHKG